MTKPKKKATHDGKDLLTTEERGVAPPELESEDDAEQASIDSFPASDPPSYQPAHAGNPTALPIHTKPSKSNRKTHRR
jgi:hypothetical protein